MIDQIYSDAEYYNAIQSGILTYLENSKQTSTMFKPLMMLAKASGQYDNAITIVTRIVVLMTKSDEGLSILKDLGIDEEIKRFTTS